MKNDNSNNNSVETISSNLNLKEKESKEEISVFELALQGRKITSEKILDDLWNITKDSD